MDSRIFAAAVVLLAGYLAFSDTLTASWTTTPESFVGDVGRGIGSAISGAATALTTAIGI